MAAHLCQGQAHAGQGNHQFIGQRYVIETHYGNVLARHQALVTRGAHQADGQEVIDRKKRLGPWVQAQQILALAMPGQAVKRTIERPLRA